MRFIILIPILLLSACGFHLRNKLVLPDDSPAVQVKSAAPYSKLADMLVRSLQASGVSIVPNSSATPSLSSGRKVAENDDNEKDNITDKSDDLNQDNKENSLTELDNLNKPKSVKTPYASLQILSERWGDLPIAIDSQGRAQEFSLRYAVIFTFKRADGSVLVPQQVVELSRDYVAPPENAVGTTSERDILSTELRREMSASIIRRIDSVVRSELTRSQSKDNQKPSDSTDSTESTSDSK